MVLYILIVSFLLDGIVSNYVPINSLFIPLFSLISLIACYSYYYDDNVYYRYAFFIGFAYDLIYTDTFIYYAFLFLLMVFIVSKLSKFFESNYINLIVATIISIVIFRSITYLLTVVTGNISFDIDFLLKGIYSSIIINVIYSIFLKFLCDIINSKKRKRKYY